VSNSKKTQEYAIVIAPNWDKGGSNNIFAAQIRHYEKKNWQSVVLFTNEFRHPSSLNQVANSELAADKKSDLYVSKFRRYFWFFVSKYILRNDVNGAPHRHPINRFARLNREMRDFVRGKRLREICVNWFDYVDAASRIREQAGAPDAPIVLHTHDVMARHKHTRRGKPVDITQFEIDNVRKADRVIHVSTQDADYFGPRVNRPQATSYLTLAPNMERLIANLKYRPVPRTVLYVGSWNYANPDSIKWFFRQVMPHTKKDITFLIAGNICEFLKNELCHEVQVPNVHLLHRVEDLIDLYQTSQLVMLPDLGETGASMKFVETLAMGMPFVATSRALRGVPDDVRAAVALCITDDPQDFADKIDQFLSKPALLNTQALYWKYFSNAAWSARVDSLDPAASQSQSAIEQPSSEVRTSDGA
jgi:glycosyltransferase involved in cell wall biosynthesis